MVLGSLASSACEKLYDPRVNLVGLLLVHEVTGAWDYYLLEAAREESIHRFTFKGIDPFWLVSHFLSPGSP